MEKNRILYITSRNKQGQILGKKLLRGYSKCLPESSLYSICVTNNLKNLKQNICSEEMKVLMDCVKLNSK
jgi:hypothetical protein